MHLRRDTSNRNNFYRQVAHWFRKTAFAEAEVEPTDRILNDKSLLMPLIFLCMLQDQKDVRSNKVAARLIELEEIFLGLLRQSSFFFNLHFNKIFDQIP